MKPRYVQGGGVPPKKKIDIDFRNLNHTFPLLQRTSELKVHT